MLTSLASEHTFFDSVYVAKLRDGEEETSNHFAHYFSSLLKGKLRKRLRQSDSADDVEQETMRRVLEAIARGEPRNPERLVAFVNTICNNVLYEYWRLGSRYVSMEDSPELIDGQSDLEKVMEDAERSRDVRAMVSKLPPRQRQLLQMTYWNNYGNSTVGCIVGVKPDYVRVLLHRAKQQLRKLLEVSAV
jgi:RNA polymerase sigma-70 factor (ECF subfamily)